MNNIEASISSRQAIEKWLEESYQVETILSFDSFQNVQPPSIPHEISVQDGDMAQRLRLKKPFLDLQEHDQNKIRSSGKSAHRKRRRHDSSVKCSSKTTSSCDKKYSDVCKHPQRYRSFDSGSEHSEDRSRSSSHSDGNEGTPPILYERRPRRKTKTDKYDLKNKSKRRSKSRKETVGAKGHKKHKRREKSSAALLKGFSARNVNTERLTLRPSSIGLFTKGRASSPRKRSGLPDLAFSEIKFLEPRRKGSNSDREVAKASASFQPPRKRAAVDKDEEMFHFFTSDHKKHQTQHNSKHPTRLRELKSRCQGRRKDMPRYRSDVLDKISPLSKTEVPETTAVGSKEPGPSRDGSNLVGAILCQPSSSHRNNQEQSTPLRTSQISWSKSPASNRRTRKEYKNTQPKGGKAQSSNTLSDEDTSGKRIESDEADESPGANNSRKQPTIDNAQSQSTEMVDNSKILENCALLDVREQKATDRDLGLVYNLHQSHNPATISVHASHIESENPFPDSRQRMTVPEHVSKMESELLGFLDKWSSRMQSLPCPNEEQTVTNGHGNEVFRPQERIIDEVPNILNAHKRIGTSGKGQRSIDQQRWFLRDSQPPRQKNSEVSKIYHVLNNDENSINFNESVADAWYSQVQLPPSLDHKPISRLDMRAATWDGQIRLYERQLCDEHNNSGCLPKSKSTTNAKDTTSYGSHTHVYGIPLSQSMRHEPLTRQSFHTPARNSNMLSGDLFGSAENLEGHGLIAEPTCLELATEQDQSYDEAGHEDTVKFVTEPEPNHLHYKYSENSETMGLNSHSPPQSNYLRKNEEGGTAQIVGGEGNDKTDDPVEFWKPHRLY